MKSVQLWFLTVSDVLNSSCACWVTVCEVFLVHSVSSVHTSMRPCCRMWSCIVLVDFCSLLLRRRTSTNLHSTCIEIRQTPCQRQNIMTSWPCLVATCSRWATHFSTMIVRNRFDVDAVILFGISLLVVTFVDSAPLPEIDLCFLSYDRLPHAMKTRLFVFYDNGFHTLFVMKDRNTW